MNKSPVGFHWPTIQDEASTLSTTESMLTGMANILNSTTIVSSTTDGLERESTTVEPTLGKVLSTTLTSQNTYITTLKEVMTTHATVPPDTNGTTENTLSTASDIFTGDTYSTMKSSVSDMVHTMTDTTTEAANAEITSTTLDSFTNTTSESSLISTTLSSVLDVNSTSINGKSVTGKQDGTLFIILGAVLAILVVALILVIVFYKRCRTRSFGVNTEVYSVSHTKDTTGCQFDEPKATHKKNGSNV